MIRLGVDFGTTSCVVAISGSRGVQVATHGHGVAGGPAVAEDVFPSLVARASGPGGGLLFGLAAEAEGRRASGRTLRSVKRALAAYHEVATVEIGDEVAPLGEVVTALLAALRESTEAWLGQPFDRDAPVVATVPANANGAQRWVTRQAYRDAGWPGRLRLMDEPTAAAIELVSRAARRRRGYPPGEMTVLVYDLGGGTFDAALVRVAGESVEVLSNGGIWHLGGDDFDRLLAEIAARAAGVPIADLAPMQLRNLLAECRRVKESLAAYPRPPRRVLVDLVNLGLARAAPSLVRVDVAELAARIAPAIAETLAVVDEVLDGQPRPDVVALVGGSTLLPFVPAAVEERFEQVQRSARPFESVAIGAAMSHDLAPGRITHRLARSFGVVRVGGADHAREYLDVLFPRGTKLPVPGQVLLAARGPYRPAHDLGVLRYLECSTVGHDGAPGRNRRDWRVVRFPYDPGLGTQGRDATRAPRRRDDLDVRVTEEYLLDADGVVSVRIRREPDGYAERHEVCG